MSIQENRSIVTPYAFSVSEGLLGTSLAHPFWRLAAISVDLCVIAFLSMLKPSFILFTCSGGLYLIARHYAFKKFWRVIAVILAIIFFIVVFVDIVTYIDNRKQMEEQQERAPSVSEVTRFTKNVIQFELCEDVECKKSQLRLIASETGFPVEERRSIIDGLIEKSGMTSEEKLKLAPEEFEYKISQKNTKTSSNLESGNVPDEQGVKNEDINLALDSIATSNNEEQRVGLIAWVKAILKDLGLGFGWAAMYFTLCTSFWNGQTLGKKIFRIKVVLLDGSTPGVWQSFSRYGGYAAGLSTGLVGYLQVFWDANRQAIQDKISETLVVKN